MPTFTPDSVHKATASFRNPKSAGFDYSASLCMGASWTEMVSVSFYLNAGESKNIEFPVTMPADLGTYPVYFKVSCGGVLIGTFVAAEDVRIVLPRVAVSAILPANTEYWCPYLIIWDPWTRLSPIEPYDAAGFAFLPTTTTVTFNLPISPTDLWCNFYIVVKVGPDEFQAFDYYQGFDGLPKLQIVGVQIGDVITFNYITKLASVSPQRTVKYHAG